MTPKIYLLLILLCTVLIGCIAKPSPEISHEDQLNSIDDNEANYREQYAKQMLSYMNLSVQPCDDFYEYACGNWKNTIQDRQCDQHRQNFLDLTYTVNEFIDLLLKRDNINDVAPEYAHEFEMTKNFYYNCLEADLYPMRKSQEYLDIIQNIGGFPAVDPKWNASDFSWVNMSAHLSNYGVNSLINEKISSMHPFDPIFLLPEFGFDIQLHYDNVDNVSSIEYQMNKKRMHDILSLYDVAEDERVKVVDDIFAFLNDTLDLFGQFGESQAVCDDMSKEMLRAKPNEDLTERWVPYFDIAWMGKSVELGDANGPCIFFYDEFHKIAERHKEAIANYLSLQFLYHMDAKITEEKFQRDYCAASIRKSLKFLIDHLYMKIAFNKQMVDDVREMGKEIRESFRSVLQEADWLDDDTRQSALRKESSIGLHVGRYEDPEIIKHLLGELTHLEYIPGSYETNKLSLSRFANSLNRYLFLHEEITRNTTKPVEIMLGIEVNAFYYLADNNLYLSASVLQSPLYHQSWPNSLKYGTLGFVLGHEVTHGFDTTGAIFDYKGERNYWWSNESEKIFNERAECFVDFFNNYTVPEINRHIRGDLTKDENIADAGALNMAMMAYRRYERGEMKKLDSRDLFKKQEQMPGLDVTPDQLFFLGAAQMWCSVFKEADYWKELSDAHTIDKYRVWGMVSNNAEFAKSYNCPVGSPMNPTADKCRLW